MRPGPFLAPVVGVVTSDLGSGPSQVSQCYPGGKRGILRADPTCDLDQNSRFIVSPFLALLCPRKVPIVSWTRVPLGLKRAESRPPLARDIRRSRSLSGNPENRAAQHDLPVFSLLGSRKRVVRT